MNARDWFRNRSEELGFDAVGFARAPGADEPLPEGQRYREWLERGYAGEMGYLDRTAAKRVDPHLTLDDLRSVVVLVARHTGDAPEPIAGEGRVAQYARGRDYHNVLGRRLRKLVRSFLADWPGEDIYARVDTAPLMEKAWAERAGLGWIGKNTLLLDSDRGSYTLLAVVMTSLAIESDPPQPDQCGDCTLRLDACPTDAFAEPYVLDARRCISYLSIELRNEIPEELRRGYGDHLFGCDDCQSVCPYNLNPLGVLHPSFGDVGTPVHEDLEEVLGLDQESYTAMTRGRALARPGRDGLVRNACVVAGNSGDRRYVTSLTRLLDDDSEIVRRHAGWALEQIESPGT